MIAYAAVLLLALVAVEHLYFLYLEMFAWTAPATLRAFGMTLESAEASRVLAANQGLYNGFLAAGIVWALVAPLTLHKPLALFFTACVVIAGLYGGAAASRRILLVQALPAALAFLAVLFS